MMLMAIFSSKWAIAGLIILSILIFLLIVGRKSAHAEVIIEANPAQVWQNLAEVSKVKVWNTVLIPIEGQLQEGTKVTYEFYQEQGGKAAVMSANVKEIVPSKLINQTGGMPLILTFNHKYRIEPFGGQTKVIIHEEYRGVMVPFWNPSPVEKAYERLLDELKVESSR